MVEQRYGYINKIAGWLFIACLSLFFLSAAIAITANFAPLYSYGFEKWNITTVTGIEKEQLEVAAVGLRDYFNSDEEHISVTIIRNEQPFDLFNEKETLHLKDVKDLFRLDYLIVGITFVYTLSYVVFNLAVKEKRRLAKAIVWGSRVTLGLMLLMGFGILLGFDSLFWEFHEIVFSNDFWLLDPSKDFLVMLFPGGFWYDAAALIAILTALEAATSGGGAWLYIRKTEEKTQETLP